VGSTSQPKHTTQTVPPAIRRRVLRRDRDCCVVPECRHSTFVDVHHLELRSEGGSHEEDNLVVLCAAHHRAVHRGQLVIDGKVSTGLRFRHADGLPYGALPLVIDSDSIEKVFLGLRGLGFSERDCRRALEEVRTRRELSSLEELLRACIELLS
jgi:hypothetical protein